MARILLKILVLISCIVAITYSQQECNFAFKYRRHDLINSIETQKEFVTEACFWEGKFGATDGVGYNAKTGMTYDGHQVDIITGQLTSPQHTFSAPSKESIHNGVLVRALLGDRNALLFFDSGRKCGLDYQECLTNMNVTETTEFVLGILEKKITTYEQFNKDWPGFGGFLPWYQMFQNESRISLLGGWTDTVPSLDNGENIWTIFAIYNTLYDLKYSQLAARYENYFSLLKKNAKNVFWSGNGKVRAVTKIVNVTTVNPTANNFQDNCDCWLDDPYEGELFTNFLDLFAAWESEEERNSVWIRKRNLLQNLNFVTEAGENITVQRGWWFSSHEQWKYMEMPYLSIPIQRRVFSNGERARTSYSANTLKIPGLFASVTNVTYLDHQNPNYISAAGIHPIAFCEINTTAVITPYGSFPSLLLDDVNGNRSVGLSWYHNMLMSPRGQGPYGSSEAQLIDGTAISPVITWDSKVTTVMALLGGVQDIVHKYMMIHNTTYQPESLYSRFSYIINREWNLAFPSLSGENISYSYPQSNVPNKLSFFPSCKISNK